jgi:hypothetical protein
MRRGILIIATLLVLHEPPRITTSTDVPPMVNISAAGPIMYRVDGGWWTPYHGPFRASERDVTIYAAQGTPEGATSDVATLLIADPKPVVTFDPPWFTPRVTVAGASLDAIYTIDPATKELYVTTVDEVGNRGHRWVFDVPPWVGGPTAIEARRVDSIPSGRPARFTAPLRNLTTCWPIAGETLTFKFDNVLVMAQTDANGVASTTYTPRFPGLIRIRIAHERHAQYGPSFKELATVVGEP